jgi:hypothetical protein
MGVLSALPIVAAGNVCCLWVLGAGVVAAYLLQQNHPQPISPADGALAGWLAGIAGAFIYLVVSVPVSLLVEPYERLLFQRLFETMGNMPPQFQQFANRNVAAGLRIALALVGFFFMLGLGAIFSTVGGLLGAVVFQKKVRAGPVEAPARAAEAPPPIDP